MKLTPLSVAMGLVGVVIALSIHTTVAQPTFTHGLGAASPAILVLMPSQSHVRLVGGKMVRVGSYFDEFAIPALALKKAGFNLVIATPQGSPPVVDPKSNSSSNFDNDAAYKEAVDLWNDLPTVIPFAQLATEHPDSNEPGYLPSLEQFDGLFIPGGHSPITDLMTSMAVGRIISYFVDANKPIGAICHGPLALAAASLVRKPWPFEGMRMTVFSMLEEKAAQMMLGGRVGLTPPDVLEDLGADVSTATIPFSSKVVVDGQLVTGQNPKSAPDFATAFLKILHAAKDIPAKLNDEGDVGLFGQGRP